MKSSHILAVALAIGAAVWVLSGELGGAPAPATGTGGQPAVEAAPQKVRVADSSSQPYSLDLTVTGRTEASRQIALRVETTGQVAEIAVIEGQYLAQGDLIVLLAADDRQERLRRAETLVEQRQIEADASAELAESGWRAQTSDAGARAELQNARAELAAIRLDIARTRVTAPFPGILDTLDVEIGDVLDTNMEIGTLYDLDPLIIVAAVSEREIGDLAVGKTGIARLITGEHIEGTVRFISRVAEPATRTFRVELEVPNPDHTLPAGLTADVVLPLATIAAHFVSPAVLSLADDGTLGVKIVDEAATVRFVPVTIVADAADGIWISGLPTRATIVTVGHDYVADGQTVEAVRVEGSAFSAQP